VSKEVTNLPPANLRLETCNQKPGLATDKPATGNRQLAPPNQQTSRPVTSYWAISNCKLENCKRVNHNRQQQTANWKPTTGLFIVFFVPP